MDLVQLAVAERLCGGLNWSVWVGLDSELESFLVEGLAAAEGSDDEGG